MIKRLKGSQKVFSFSRLGCSGKLYCLYQIIHLCCIKCAFLFQLAILCNSMSTTECNMVQRLTLEKHDARASLVKQYCRSMNRNAPTYTLVQATNQGQELFRLVHGKRLLLIQEIQHLSKPEAKGKLQKIPYDFHQLAKD